MKKKSENLKELFKSNLFIALYFLVSEIILFILSTTQNAYPYFVLMMILSIMFFATIVYVIAMRYLNKQIDRIWIMAIILFVVLEILLFCLGLSRNPPGGYSASLVFLILGIIPNAIISSLVSPFLIKRNSNKKRK